MKDVEFWGELLEHLRNGQPAFLSLVAFNTTHSPGTRGAKIFVRPDESIVGTIGGGILEADVIDKGINALNNNSTFVPNHETLIHRKKSGDGDGKESGLICAGRQTHVYFVCEPENHTELVAEIVRRIKADESGLIQINRDGLKLAEETESIDANTPPIRLKNEDSETNWIYEEQIINWKRAAVFGGGHVGTAVCRQLTLLGYTVENFDTRAQIFEHREKDWADHIHVLDDYADGGDLVRFPGLTHGIVVTADQPSDVRALLGLAGLPLPYVGAMGSPAKLHKIKEDLSSEGVPEEWFEKVRSPIGLDMTSNKPPEIAVSIASELLRLRPELFPHSKPPKPEPAS